METNLNMHPKCIHPVRSKRNPKKCMCGREIAVWGPHAIKVNSKTNETNNKRGDVFDTIKQAAGETWDVATDTVSKSTTSYGLITFRPKKPGSDLDDSLVSQAKPYVRVSTVDCLNSPEKLKEMLVSKWDLEPPRIMLAVTGGAQSFDLPPKLDSMLKKGLAKAAKSESLWITTGGTNSGVMKYVASAVAESGCYIPVIGFLSWSIVSQKEVLDTYPDGQPVQGGLVYYGNPDKQPIGLDQNHTHFVMVDDGTQMQFGGEIGSKASIENSVSEGLSLGKFGSESPISTVLLAIQGGPGTVDTVLACLKSSTPCVIVNGSGKASNVIAYAYGLPLAGERPTSTGHTLEGLEELIMNEFECHTTAPMFSKIKDVCMECMQYKEYIHIYTVDFSGSGNEELDVSLDVALLQAVLDHDRVQWEKYNKKVALVNASLPQKQRNEKEVADRIRLRDLSRVLRLELSLMWNRIEVVKKEVSQYCVLTQLSKRSSQMMYKTKREVEFLSLDKSPVKMGSGTVVELLKIMGDRWLVRDAKKADQQGWVAGKMFEKDKRKPNFADTVILAQLHMLKWLLINEKLDFVELFLQGMRPADVTAFLSLRVRNVWAAAATFGVGVQSAEDEEEETKEDENVTQKIMHQGKVVTVDRKDKMKMDKTKKERRAQNPKLNMMLLQQHLQGHKSSMTRANSTISDVSELTTLSMNEKELHEKEATARRMLKKNKTFDESDVQETPYYTTEWKANIADAHFQCWVDKKWAQYKSGFDMKASTLECIKKRGNDKSPRKIELNQLPMWDQQGWLDRANLFLKMLRGRGYIVSKYRGKKQLDKFGGIKRVHDHDELVDSLAKLQHAAWLQKKLEDHWVCESHYNEKRKESPYVRLYTNLTESERAYICNYATMQIRVLLDGGFWIWRPDMLESCYYESGCTQGINFVAHLLNLFTEGQFWRAQVHDRLTELIGSRYKRDFSTFAALDPYFHLMVWSVVTKRFVLAEFFWKQSPADSIVNALIAANICESLIKRDKNFTPEVRNEFEEYSKRMKANSLGILKTCKEIDSTHTRELIEAQYPTIGWMCMWELAYNLKDDKFTSDNLYIDVIKKEWFGHIDADNGFMKVILGILCPLYLIFYTDDQEKEEGNNFMSSLLMTFTLRVDHSELITTRPPTISWSPSTKRITIATTTPHAKIFFTRDGTDPRQTGEPYVDGPSTTMSDVADRGSQGSGANPGKATAITLPDDGFMVIRAVAYCADMTQKFSEETVKEINCGSKDMVLGDIPEFSIGPPPSKAHWAKYGLAGKIMHRFYCFYSAPYVTFWSDLIFNLVYVTLYSYSSIVPTITMDELFQLNDQEKIIPVVVFLWTGMLMTDESRQAITAGFRDWWGSFWNKWDFFMYLNSVMCIVLRLKYEDRTYEGDRLHSARVFYALGALILWLRLGRLYALSPKLGPKLVMIGRMLEDLLVFMALLMVVLVGYGVTMHAILEPWRTFDQQSPNTIFFKPMFHVLGDTFLTNIQEHTDCYGEDFTQCNDSTNYLIVVLLILYLVISNIMLVNLLIAMMAATYAKIDEEATAIWSLQNVDLLEEFRELLPLPPPLSMAYNIVEGAIGLIKALYNKFSSAGTQKVQPSDGGEHHQHELQPGGSALVTKLRSKRDSEFLREWTLKFFDEDAKKDAIVVARTEIKDLINFHQKELQDKLQNLEFYVQLAAQQNASETPKTGGS